MARSAIRRSVCHPDERDNIVVVEKIEDLDTELDVIKNAENFGVLERLDLGETDRIAPIDAEIGRQMKLSRAVLLQNGPKRRRNGFGWKKRLVGWRKNAGEKRKRSA